MKKTNAIEQPNAKERPHTRARTENQITRKTSLGNLWRNPKRN